MNNDLYISIHKDYDSCEWKEENQDVKVRFCFEIYTEPRGVPSGGVTPPLPPPPVII